MDTLIVVCLVLSSSLAAPQQYVLPTPPGSHQLQNPRDFNPLPGQINNIVPQNQLGQAPPLATAPQQYVLPTPPGSNQLQNPRDFNPLPGQINNVVPPNQLSQAPPLATASAQQAFLSIHNNQDQSSFGLQASQNTQAQSLISLQENTGANNEYGQNIQNGFGNINNVNNDVLNNDFASNSGNRNGQTSINNIGLNNDLNNPIRVASSIGLINQGTTHRGSSNGINGNNVDPNGNVNELLATNLAGAQHFSRGDNTHVNGNVVFDVNTQGLSSNLNSANSENNNFIAGQSDHPQNNDQLIQHQSSHLNQNLNNNAQVAAVENLELNNELNLNQDVQNTGDNPRPVTDNTIMSQQRNEVNSRCGKGLVPNARGACVHPEVSRNIFVYAAPKMSHDSTNTSSEVPRPKIEYNLVFVRTPKANGNGEPIIVPPPQQKTLVYVLSKNNANGAQEIIEVPAGPQHNPEVYYVNYEEGDNPILPGGIELETALSASAQTGQTINDILRDPLLREEISHDNIAFTDNTRSKIKDTMVNGIDIHETAEDNLANTFINNPNNEETYNNDENANNQLDQTSNVDVLSITGASSDIGFSNNNFGLNTAGVISPNSVGNFDGSSHTGDVGVPLGNGINTGSVGNFDGSSHTGDVGVPLGNGVNTGSVGTFGGPPHTGDVGVPLGNGVNTGSASFVTNGEGPNFRQALPTPQRFYNTH